MPLSRQMTQGNTQVQQQVSPTLLLSSPVGPDVSLVALYKHLFAATESELSLGNTGLNKSTQSCFVFFSRQETGKTLGVQTRPMLPVPRGRALIPSDKNS